MSWLDPHHPFLIGAHFISTKGTRSFSLSQHGQRYTSPRDLSTSQHAAEVSPVMSLPRCASDRVRAPGTSGEPPSAYLQEASLPSAPRATAFWLCLLPLSLPGSHILSPATQSWTSSRVVPSAPPFSQNQLTIDGIEEWFLFAFFKRCKHLFICYWPFGYLLL